MRSFALALILAAGAFAQTAARPAGNRSAPLEFVYWPQLSQQNFGDLKTDIPALSPEWQKAGVLVRIKNRDGVSHYAVRVTFDRLKHPVNEPVLTGPEAPTRSVVVEAQKTEANETFAVLWLGSEFADHRVLKVEVEALAIVARGEHEPK